MDKQQADTLALLLVRDLIKSHHAITIQGENGSEIAKRLTDTAKAISETLQNDFSEIDFTLFQDNH